MGNYFKTPFAASGDKTAIPDTAPPDGSVSFASGYGVDYQIDPSTPPGLDIERDKFNELMYQVTLAVQQYQQNGFPDFITTSDNGGVAYEYAIYATVRFAGGWAGAGTFNYYSLVDTNTTTPADATKWGLVQYGTQTFITGDMLPWAFNTIRTGGWIWMNGTTIGNASSGSTGRANADTSTLFAMLWTDYANAVLPIQDSSGNPSTRGANAAADFAANKRLPVPDYRGRAFFGIDNMGGASTAGRITNAESGIAGTTLGSNGGAQSVALTGNQNGTHQHTGTTDSAGSHAHTVNDPGHSHTPAIGGNFIASGSSQAVIQNPGFGLQTGASTTSSATTGVTLQNSGVHTHMFTSDNSGLGSTHLNMPPAYIGGGYIMKL